MFVLRGWHRLLPLMASVGSRVNALTFFRGQPRLEIHQVPSEQSKVHLTVLRKYRKLLQDLVSSGSLGEEHAFLEITDIVPLTRKGHFEVHCFLPSLIYGTENVADSQVRSHALRLQHAMNTQANEIRSKVCQYNVEYKRPTFHFVVRTDTESTPSAQSFSQSSGDIDPVESNQSKAPLMAIKPTNVYNLPRDELLKKVKLGLKNVSYDFGQISDEPTGSESNEMPRATRTDPQVTSEWAKLWKQRQDSRSKARRERKRARQNIGLYRLTRDQNGLTITDVNSEED